eukprot:267496-Rhodomonas_salina.1
MTHTARPYSATRGAFAGTNIPKFSTTRLVLLPYQHSQAGTGLARSRSRGQVSTVHPWRTGVSTGHTLAVA